MQHLGHDKCITIIVNVLEHDKCTTIIVNVLEHDKCITIIVNVSAPFRYNWHHSGHNNLFPKLPNNAWTQWNVNDIIEHMFTNVYQHSFLYRVSVAWTMFQPLTKFTPYNV